MRNVKGKDTIFALASGQGRAAIAVLRLSGPKVPEVLSQIVGNIPPPRYATYVTLKSPAGEILDRSILLWFPAPNSFTGEDSAELHLHGGGAVIQAVCEVLSSFPTCRLAERGEFTQRAYFNGKMDLMQIEGLADLLEAETRHQRRQALHHMSGYGSQHTEGWRHILLRTLALVEAKIDFSEEDATAFQEADRVLEESFHEIKGLSRDLDRSLEYFERGAKLREGFRILLLGPPNAGKSSLLNRLAQRDVALVSPFEGTTRDSLEVHLELNGLPVIVTDTAGVRETEDALEKLSISRTQQKAQEADLILWLEEITSSLPLPGTCVTLQESEVVRQFALQHLPRVKIYTKCDLLSKDFLSSKSILDLLRKEEALIISSSTGENMDALLTVLEQKAGQALQPTAEPALLTRTRHKKEISEARQALQSALRAYAQAPQMPEILAEDLRYAATALGRLCGRISSEEILGEIFSQFCVGK